MYIEQSKRDFLSCFVALLCYVQAMVWGMVVNKDVGEQR
jgi:hypothetical protein